MPDHDPNIAAELRHSLRRLVYATAILYVVVAALGGLGWLENHRSTQDNKRRICAAEAVLIKSARVQLARSRLFLKTHPEGIPGVSVGLLRKSIITQHEQITALIDPSCKAIPPAPKHG